MQKRMAWVQENSWEALMMFAPAVLLATFLQVEPGTMNLLAGGFLLWLASLICGAMPKILPQLVQASGLWGWLV